MKKVLCFLLSVLAIVSFADKKAVTESGDVVILKNDGTWAYKNANTKNSQKNEIAINKQKFTKDANATFAVKSKRNNAVFLINPKKYTSQRSKFRAEQEFFIRHKTKDIYAVTISEESHYPLESFPNIVITNAKRIDPDAMVTEKEYRFVNGKKVIRLRVKAEVNKIKIDYIYYCCTEESGSTKFVAFTSSELFKKHQVEMETLLNGLVFQQTAKK